MLKGVIYIIIKIDNTYIVNIVLKLRTVSSYKLYWKNNSTINI
jgi:hypothetical protein